MCAVVMYYKIWEVACSSYVENYNCTRSGVVKKRIGALDVSLNNHRKYTDKVLDFTQPWPMTRQPVNLRLPVIITFDIIAVKELTCITSAPNLKHDTRGSAHDISKTYAY